MAFDIILRDNGAGSFDISFGVATDNINPTLVTNTPSVLSPALEGTITPDLTTNTPSVLSPSLEGTVAPDLVTNTPSVLSPALEGTITPDLVTRTPTVNSPTLSEPSSNPAVGYATNSGGYSPSACYGVSPTTLVYHHPSENAQPGQILIGKVLYTNDDGTGALSAASTWWSFQKDGTAADRAIQIDGSGVVVNANFRNGVVFGYADEGGDCNSTSGFDAIYNAPDDYQYWYPRKAVDKTAATIGGIMVVAGTQALSYVNTGSVIGTATFAQLNNYQNSYTSMTGCGVANRRKGRAMFFE
jgi:hypothetical protein